jgi:hypothetical protein
VTLKVIHPRKGQTVHQDFTATGTSLQPKGVTGAVLRGEFPKITLLMGKTAVKQGRWHCTFHIKSPPGEYVLALVNQLTGETRYVPINVIKTPASYKIPNQISVSYPTPGCCFHSDDTAYGFAPCAKPPSITSYFIYNDGTQSPNGKPVDEPTPTSSYWSQSFAGLQTNNNPCRYHVQGDVPGLTPADVNNITIITDAQICPNPACGDRASKKRRKK